MPQELENGVWEHDQADADEQRGQGRDRFAVVEVADALPTGPKEPV